MLGKGLAGNPGDEGTIICVLVETSDFAREGIEYTRYEGSLPSTRLVAKLGAGERVYPLFPLHSRLEEVPLPSMLVSSDAIDIVVLQVGKRPDPDPFQWIDIHDVRSFVFERVKDVEQWVICEE